MMTRDEAIAVLNMVEAHGSLVIEAKDMAIKALEQEQNEDCVSRKAMLDAITEIDGNINMDIYTNEVREIIENVPPVAPTVQAIPLDKVKQAREQIIDEKDFAYDDFEQYKEEVLHAESDELPDDDFRYGMERCLEILNKLIAESEDRQ